MLFIYRFCYNIKFHHFSFFMFWRKYLTPPTGSHIVGYSIYDIATYIFAT